MSDFKVVQLVNPIQVNTNIKPTGAYNAVITYGVADSVSYLGSSYVCILASTGNLPTNTTYWQLLASKGDTGNAGLDTNIVSPTNNQTLFYDSASTKWVNHMLIKGDVGLSNADNTSDANKPVSTAQAAADSAVQSYSIQRANHTGTQTASTISDFNSAADARVAIGITNHEAAPDPHPQYTTNIESIVNALIFG